MEGGNSHIVAKPFLIQLPNITDIFPYLLDVVWNMFPVLRLEEDIFFSYSYFINVFLLSYLNIDLAWFQLLNTLIVVYLTDTKKQNLYDLNYETLFRAPQGSIIVDATLRIMVVDI